MNQTLRVCQSCKQSFEITPEDLEFYSKIKVPAPTFCADCRLGRRMSFRNEFTFYKRSCDLCKKSIISTYRPSVACPVYCVHCWYSDAWTAEDYGMQVDFNQPFLSQVKTLMQKVPHIGTFQMNCVESDYTNYAFDSKRGYLVTGYVESESCSYGNIIWQSKDSLNCFYLVKSELCYECVSVSQCYRVSFGEDCVACNNSFFLYNCRNCSNCIGCINLVGKEYWMFNKPVSKETYQEFMSKLEPLTVTKIEELRNQFLHLKKNTIHRYANLVNTLNTTGNNVRNSKNTKSAFYANDLENSGYLFIASKIKEGFDVTNTPGLEMGYECVSAVGLYNGLFSSLSGGSEYVQYCELCPNAKNAFGCIGMRKAEYCILNKRYTKEEYEGLKTEIIEHMVKVPYVDRGNRVYQYGEFFPIELSLFPYNDSQANDYFPLSREEAMLKNFPYEEREIKAYTTTKSGSALPESINEVDESICKEIISCMECRKAYRIISSELEFYKKIGIPLPRKCPSCRHAFRTKKRNPPHLFHRECGCRGSASALLEPQKSEPEKGIFQNRQGHIHGGGPCKKQFETTYAPERSEIIYCEPCYQSEVI